MDVDIHDLAKPLKTLSLYKFLARPDNHTDNPDFSDKRLSTYHNVHLLPILTSTPSDPQTIKQESNLYNLTQSIGHLNYFLPFSQIRN